MFENYYVGVDLGQSQDYTAIAALKQTYEIKIQEAVPGLDAMRHASINKVPVYELRLLERPALHTPYPEIIERIKTILSGPELRDHATTVVDNTGVGRAVTDMMAEADISNVIAVTITAGEKISHDEHGDYRVPKKELVSSLQVAFQSGRLKIASALPLAETLREEILSFRIKTNLVTGHESFEAWREKDHDDLVLATALALWYGSVAGYSGEYFPDGGDDEARNESFNYLTGELE